MSVSEVRSLSDQQLAETLKKAQRETSKREMITFFGEEFVSAIGARILAKLPVIQLEREIYSDYPAIFPADLKGNLAVRGVFFDRPFIAIMVRNPSEKTAAVEVIFRRHFNFEDNYVIVPNTHFGEKLSTGSRIGFGTMDETTYRRVKELLQGKELTIFQKDGTIKMAS